MVLDGRLMHYVYCTTTLGGTARGVGILRALGGGVLVTPIRDVPYLEEGIAYFGHIPLSCETLILDNIRPRRQGGRYDRVLVYGEDIEPELVLPREPAEMDPERAESWWANPPMDRVKVGRIWYDVEPEEPGQRVLSVCSSLPINRIRAFQETARGRVVAAMDRLFYWPAMELMALADEVEGGGEQVAGEWEAVQGRADPDGAKRAAAQVRKLAKRGR